MPYIFHFSPNPMTAAKYDECMQRLADAAASAPPGRLYHVSYGPPEKLRVFDVWDSQQSFEQFGQTLIPILQDLGIDAGTPEVAEVHNIVRG